MTDTEIAELQTWATGLPNMPQAQSVLRLLAHLTLVTANQRADDMIPASRLDRFAATLLAWLGEPGNDESRRELAREISFAVTADYKAAADWDKRLAAVAKGEG